MTIQRLSVRGRVRLLAILAFISLVGVTAAFQIAGVIGKRLNDQEVGYSEAANAARQAETLLLKLELSAHHFLTQREPEAQMKFRSDALYFKNTLRKLGASEYDPLHVLDLAETYISNMEKAFRTRVRLGLTEDKGLEGELREAVHDIERRLAEHGDVELTSLMLMMRRHEKDFMMRLREDYVSQFSDRVTEFRGELKRANYSAAEEAVFLDLLKVYRDQFLTWSATRLELDAQTSQAQDSLLTLSAELRRFAETAQIEAERFMVSHQTIVRKTATFLWSIVLLLIAGGMLLSIWIGRSIVGPIAQVADDMLALSTKNSTGIPAPERKNTRNELGHIRSVLDYFAANLAETERLHNEVLYHRDNLADEVAKRTAELEEKKIKLELALSQERELNEMQNQFVAMVSHEFRTPLTIIDGTARRIDKTLERSGPDEIKERLGRIRASVTRLSGMVERALDASRVAHGSIEFVPSDIDLSVVLCDIVERHREIAPDYNISIALDELPETIEADPRLLDHIFSNLVSNAIKYSKDRPDIHVRAGRDDSNVRVSIRDHGVGIPKAELPNITNRFFRASTSKGIAGTGIGLNLVANLARMHGGQFLIDSEAGEWTEVTIVLPIKTPKEAGKTLAAIEATEESHDRAA